LSEDILLTVKGVNGLVVLLKEIVVIFRSDQRKQFVPKTGFPILNISLIQLSDEDSPQGYINFVLHGTKEISGLEGASTSEYAVLFESSQSQDFENFKLETEKRIAALKFALIDRPIHTKVSPEVASQTKKGFDLEKWLDDNEELLEKALESGSKWIESWLNLEDKKLEIEKLENRFIYEQNRIGLVLFGVLIGVIFTICIIAIIKGQYELVKWILSSSFALAAGAGLRDVFLRKKKTDL